LASVPTVLAATWKQIPTLILEQNAVPGRATRFRSRRVAAVCTAFGDTGTRLPAGSRVVLAGNPVRAAIADLCRRETMPDPAGPSTLLILGGSQGAESLNEAVVAMLEQPPPQLADWRIVHQTGVAQHDRIAAAYRVADRNCVVQPFFEDLSDWYARARLVIARAGATTLAELACAGSPVVLHPYPHAADNHQLANARVYEAAGAALVIGHHLSPLETAQQLKATIAALAGDVDRQAAMRAAMRRLARPEAARNVVAVLQSLWGGSIT
jgi:UDP-N-acetylglucosamine--N-acetylmuramyl-(pentapeptide) pyrophosphoryl-undecaprenol N-acetylglucosamine transferase